MNIENNFRKILLHTPVPMTRNHENLQQPFICDMLRDLVPFLQILKT